jgi:rubredoxin
LEKDKLDEEQKADDASRPQEAEEPKTEGAQPHVCLICGFVYDPEQGDPSMGIPPGTPFEDLPEDYKCPICNASKDYFREV